MRESPNDAGAQVAAAIAHEVNSPLAVVLASIDLTVEALARLRASGAGLEPAIADAEAYLADARAAATEIQAGLARRVAPARPASQVVPRLASPVVDARVLVVDDQQSVGRALERLLRGYDVVSLVDPREALARIDAGERFAVILCDLMMPELTGAVLYERVRLLDPEQASRIAFLTGGATTAETRAFVDRTAQPVLLKPFVVSELRAVVARIAAQYAQTTP